eukprot:2340148-Lingulodinium_polyedra.AAC.1
MRARTGGHTWPPWPPHPFPVLLAELAVAHPVRGARHDPGPLSQDGLRPLRALMLQPPLPLRATR